MFETRPRHAAEIATIWHLGLGVALSALAIAAWVGLIYHQRASRWPYEPSARHRIHEAARRLRSE